MWQFLDIPSILYIGATINEPIMWQLVACNNNFYCINEESGVRFNRLVWTMYWLYSKTSKDFHTWTLIWRFRSKGLHFFRMSCFKWQLIPFVYLDQHHFHNKALYWSDWSCRHMRAVNHDFFHSVFIPLNYIKSWSDKLTHRWLWWEPSKINRFQGKK